MIKIKRLIGFSLLVGWIAIGVTLFGCATKLEQGGAYAPVGQASDMVLFTADAAYKLAYTTLDNVFLFERNNREMLWRINPEIKKSVDGMRTLAIQYQKDWAVARKAYLDSPVAENLKTMELVIANMQRMAQVASVVIIRYQNP